MKKIKKIVLRSATKLTNSEMKKLRGGYDPGNNRPSSCIIPCPDGFGGGSVELDCSKSGGGYCDIYSGVNSYGIPYYGVACFAEENVLTDRNVKDSAKYQNCLSNLDFTYLGDVKVAEISSTPSM